MLVHQLELLFVDLPRMINDPTLVDIKYIGRELPAATPAVPITPVAPEGTPADVPTADRLTSGESEDDFAYAAVVAAAAGGLVAMALVVAGLRRMDKDKHDAEDALKPDDKSNDGESTANHTADMTYANSCSSLSSPSRSTEGSNISPASLRVSPEKFFALAEEEEKNWRELSILPALAQDDGTLENVSEEGSFLGTVSPTSSPGNGEMSV